MQRRSIPGFLVRAVVAAWLALASVLTPLPRPAGADVGQLTLETVQLTEATVTVTVSWQPQEQQCFTPASADRYWIRIEWGDGAVAAKDPAECASRSAGAPWAGVQHTCTARSYELCATLYHVGPSGRDVVQSAVCGPATMVVPPPPAPSPSPSPSPSPAPSAPSVTPSPAPAASESSGTGPAAAASAPLPGPPPPERRSKRGSPTGPFALTIVKIGAASGTVTSLPEAVNCGTVCTREFRFLTEVLLVPLAAPGSVFSGWSGLGSCSSGRVTMSSHTTCIATFARIGGVAFDPPMEGPASSPPPPDRPSRPPSPAQQAGARAPAPASPLLPAAELPARQVPATGEPAPAAAPVASAAPDIDPPATPAPDVDLPAMPSPEEVPFAPPAPDAAPVRRPTITPAVLPLAGDGMPPLPGAAALAGLAALLGGVLLRRVSRPEAGSR